MFQYAALVGFAAASGCGWCIPRQNSEIRKRVGSLGYSEMFELPQCFNLEYEYMTVAPKHFFREDGRLYRLPEGTDICGYFQSEKYFAHVKGEVLRQFTFKSEIVDTSLGLMPDAEAYVSLHVRRGDYVAHPAHHPLVSMEWYDAAMKLFGCASCLIFSDDIEWCKRSFGAEHRCFASGNQFVDMCTMTRCKGHIIANSSFSWWAAYLSGRKTVAPKQWFGAAIDSKNDGSIYPPGWIVV